MAEPIPVDRQKQLFDATKEAEKVLHYLSSMSPSQLTLQLLPNLFERTIVEMKKKLEIGMVCVCVYIRICTRVYTFVFVFTYVCSLQEYLKYLKCEKDSKDATSSILDD